MFEKLEQSCPNVEDPRKTLADRPGDFQFCREYWYHLGWLRNVKTQCQEWTKAITDMTDSVQLQMAK